MPVDTRQVIYSVDAADRIVSVNTDFLQFATENGFDVSGGKSCIGQSLWKYVSGTNTIHLWHVIFARVREGSEAVTIPYRCDSPDCRRYMQVTISRLQNNGLELISSILRIEPRPNLPLLDPKLQRKGGCLLLCSWCKRVRLPDRWTELEDAATTLQLFEHAELPAITHGACPECAERVLKLFDEQH